MSRSHSAHEGLQLERQGYNRPRRSVDRGGTHAQLEQNGGQLLQINTFSQFHKLFHLSIRQFQAPQAICGYVSMASAVACNAMLSKLPGRRVSSVKQLHQLEAALRDAPSLLPGIRESMNFVFQSRKRYIDSHGDKFRSERSRREYLSAWVANFEISDFFRDQQRRGVVDLKGVMFLRFNQASELGAATHEERQRIIEEEVKFGSAKRKACDKATDFTPGDVVFLAETFSPKWSLNTPEHYAATANAKESEVVAPASVFVLDLNGHFCIAVPARIDGKQLLVLFNTTSANYLTGAGGLVSAMAYDLSFCTLSSDSCGTGHDSMGQTTSGLDDDVDGNVVCIETDDFDNDNAVIDLTTSSNP